MLCTAQFQHILITLYTLIINLTSSELLLKMTNKKSILITNLNFNSKFVMRTSWPTYKTEVIARQSTPYKAN